MFDRYSLMSPVCAEDKMIRKCGVTHGINL